MKSELFLKTMTEFSQELKRAFTQNLEKKIDLTYPQWRVMKEVKFSDGDVTASDIVQKTGTDKVTVSGVVNRLIQKGYLIKTKDPNDSRRGLLTISEKAHTMCKDVMYMEQQFRDRVFEQLEDDEVHDYLQTTEKLLTKLKEINGGNK